MPVTRSDTYKKQGGREQKGLSGTTYYEARWNEMYQQLVAFRKKRCQQTKKLGIWVSTQRKTYKSKKLIQDRINKLNDIGFVWEADCNVAREEEYNERWNEMFKDLVDYKEKEGHCDVPQRYKQNKKLGKWVMTQRKSHKKKTLLQDRVAKLNDIGFVWEADCNVAREEVYNERWNEMFKDLVDYKEKHGNCNVPHIYPENPSLGKWVCKQCVSYKNNMLSQDRIDKLQGRGSSRISQIEKQKAAELKAQYDNEKAGAKKEGSGDKKSDGAEDDNEEGAWLENEDNLSFAGVSSEVSSLESFKAQNIGF
eukprot:scaffold11022_cov38-Cyclotella_meneghiniana.AAC.3